MKTHHLLTCVGLLIASTQISSAAITYIDATTANVSNSTTANSASDHLWYYRTDNGWDDAYGTGQSHMLTTEKDSNLWLNEGYMTIDFSLAGLNAGDTADVYLYYFKDSQIRYKLSPGDNAITSVATLATAGYSIANKDSAGLELVDTSNSGVGALDATSTRGRLLIGQLTSDGSNEAKLYVNLTSVNGQRSYFDGVGIEAVPEPSAYAAIAGFLALSWVMLRRRA